MLKFKQFILERRRATPQIKAWLGTRAKPYEYWMSRQFTLPFPLSKPMLDRMQNVAKESEGFQYEGAEASFELLVRRNIPGYAPPFELDDFVIVERHRHEDGSDQSRDMIAEAMLKVRVGAVNHSPEGELCQQF